MTYYKNKHFRYVYIFGILLILFLIFMENQKKENIADDVEEIQFSAESGFYDNEFDLTITSTGGTLYYTLDGSVPTCDSIKYEGPIHISDASKKDNVYSMRTDVSTGFQKELINKYSKDDPGYESPQYKIDKCTIVRAVIYYGNERYSNVKTASYFVGFDKKSGYKNMNVISIVTDPDNLFGYENGIYVTGKTFDDYIIEDIYNDFYFSYWMHWRGNYSLRGKENERIASCQFFNAQGKLILSQACGIRIHGGGSRGYNPKSLNLYAREEYNGKDYFIFNFFNNEFFPSTVTLTSGGDDMNSKMRDYLMNELASELNVATMDFVPYVLFLDGEYWGVYWMTEKYDKEYVHYHYGVDTDNVVMIKNGSLEEGEESDYELYEAMIDFCSTSDMTDEKNYIKACELIDMDSYIDYYASLIYVSRTGDWPGGNYALWRSKKTGNGEYEDGKWRWMIFDLYNNSMEDGLVKNDTIDHVMNQSPMFCNLMKNEEFKDSFLNRLIELSETIFAPDNVEKEIDDFRNLMDIPMEQNIKRFYGDGKYNLYMDQVDSISAFFEYRGDWIPAIIEKYK